VLIAIKASFSSVPRRYRAWEEVIIGFLKEDPKEIAPIKDIGNGTEKIDQNWIQMFCQMFWH